MQRVGECVRKSNEEIISLYTKIPDYSQVKHLGDSEFINTLEKLKEEFRQCRASLLYDDDGDDGVKHEVDYISDRTSKALTLSGHKNVNFYPREPEVRNPLGLSVSTCEIHRAPNKYGVNYLSRSPSAYSAKYKPSMALALIRADPKSDSAFNDDDDCLSTTSSDSLKSLSPLSRWSSNPEIFKRSTEYIPPSNIERRILSRTNNSSLNTLCGKEVTKKKTFRANPVPSHVHKPLYDKIMLKNKRRSQRMREQSKLKLLSQIKPFSFAKGNSGTYSGNLKKLNTNSKGHQTNLNNMKSVKSKRANRIENNMKANKIDNQLVFRAKPAPPRSRALLAAIRLKEQQDYRDLKKRLRAEALLRNSTLPPSMANRHKSSNLNNKNLTSFWGKTFKDEAQQRNRKSYNKRSSSTETGYTDDEEFLERYSVETMNGSTQGAPKMCNLAIKPRGRNISGGSRGKSGKFTPFGESRHKSAAMGVFESTANDNIASKLRLKYTKMKEEKRIKHEEEEMVRALKAEQKRKRLRDSHLEAWRRACSYSSSQDIAMRRQLRMAASILENESFKQEKMSMLSRVQSAPLLLEGRKETETICRRHRCLEEGDSYFASGRSVKETPRRSPKPHYASRVNWTSTLDVGADGRSETAAFAEGSITNSDNESKGFDSDDEEEEEDRKVRKDDEGASGQVEEENDAKSEDEEEEEKGYESYDRKNEEEESEDDFDYFLR